MKIPEPKKLPSGTWFIRLRLNGVSIPVSASTRKDCVRQAELIKAEYRAEKRTVSNASGLTLSMAIDRYIRDRENTLSPSTIDGYRAIQRYRFQSVMNKRLSLRMNWQKICDDEATLCSPKTLKNSLGLIRSVYRANGMELPPVTLPQIVSGGRAWLDDDEIKKLLAYVDGKRDALVVYLALHSLRRSEIAGLTWDNVDLDRGTITVKGAIVRNADHEYVYKLTNKNASSQRTIPIMIPALRELLASADDKTGFVCKIPVQSISWYIDRACTAAGVTAVHAHGLRHSFASLCYHLGLSEMETMSLGGWSDNATMRKIYTHLYDADKAKAVEKLSDFFSA